MPDYLQSAYRRILDDRDMHQWMNSERTTVRRQRVASNVVPLIAQPSGLRPSPLKQVRSLILSRKSFLIADGGKTVQLALAPGQVLAYLTYRRKRSN